MSFSNKCIKHFSESGYKVIDNEIYNPKGKRLAKYLNPKNYYTHTFNYKKRFITLGLHRFVAYQKYGEQLFREGIVVRHKDGSSINNLEDNILIGTTSDNQMDRDPEERKKHAIKASYTNRRFNDETVKLILEDRNNGYTYKDLCLKYNTSKSTLSYFFNKALYIK